MSAPGRSDAVPDGINVESGSLPPGVKAALTSWTEREIELGIENGALRKTLEQARAGWKAEVKALRDGRRERMVGRVLASIVGVHMTRWLDQGYQPNVEEQASTVKAWATMARRVADAAIADMESAPPGAR